MKSALIFLVLIIAFGLSLTKHVSFVMYPVCAVIFYFYLPVLYASSRINILHHIKKTDIWHIKFYPIELSLWFISTCFLAFILSHLLADLLFPYRNSMYHFTYFLITLGFGGIIYCELGAKKLQKSSSFTIYKTQGRLLSFQILFMMYLLFETFA